MGINQVNSHLHQRATATAWPHGRAAGFWFAALLASFAFPALASAAVVAPVKLGGASGPLDGGALVSLGDVLAEVGDMLECMAQNGLLDHSLLNRVAARGGMTPAAPRDTPSSSAPSSSAPPSAPPKDSERFQDVDNGLLPVQSSSSSTGAGGTGSGGDAGASALAFAAPLLSAADCMITRLALADQLFPPSPPPCGIFHPPRVF